MQDFDAVEVPGRFDEPVLDATPVAPPPHPNFWWSLLWCLGLIVVGQLVPVVVGVCVLVLLLMANGNLDPARLHNQQMLEQRPEYAAATLVFIGLSQVVMVVFGWVVNRLMIGRDWTRVVGLHMPSLPQLVLTLLLLPAMLVISTGIEALGREYLPSFGNLDKMMAIFASWPWVIGAVVIGFGPGIGEELWFRGFFGRGLVARHGIVVGVVLTSLLFGLMHLDPHHVVVTFVIGLFLHGTYLATRSLLVPILLHTANNILSLSAIQLPELAVLSVPGARLSWHIYAASVVLAAAVGWGFYRCRTRLEKAGPVVTWWPSYPGVEWPPLHSEVLAVRPAGGLSTWAVVLAGVVTFAAVLPELDALQLEEQRRRAGPAPLEIKASRLP